MLESREAHRIRQRATAAISYCVRPIQLGSCICSEKNVSKKCLMTSGVSKPNMCVCRVDDTL